MPEKERATEVEQVEHMKYITAVRESPGAPTEVSLFLFLGFT